MMEYHKNRILLKLSEIVWFECCFNWMFMKQARVIGFIIIKKFDLNRTAKILSFWFEWGSGYDFLFQIVYCIDTFVTKSLTQLLITDDLRASMYADIHGFALICQCMLIFTGLHWYVCKIGINLSKRRALNMISSV